jgi:exodeoxyribonuclease V gamma subunit
VKRLDALRDQLVSWFSIKDLDGIENDGILLKLLAELNFWRTFGMDNGTIPLNTLFYSLFDRSQEMNIKTSSLFVEGVTFTDYDESSVLPAKYLFFIGANSKDFPPLERRSEIDLRPESDRLPLQYQHFESQCYNAGSKLFLSYVNLNLKTDEEYFPSTFLLKLFEGQSFDAKGGTRIGIDFSGSHE